MATIAKHDQRVQSSLMQCTRCKGDDCATCVDTIRLRVMTEQLCQCKREQHVSKVQATLDAYSAKIESTPKQ